MSLSFPHPWDGFVTGPENALAWASALALARGESAGLTPLVVHGPSGVGKSRLLAGLVAEHLMRQPGSSVAHLEAALFTALCSEAANATTGWADLRTRFRELDLFVLEDLHVLEKSSMALAELAHTLDVLAQIDAAVVLSARTGPAEWVGWPHRLVNRLVGGLVVRIDPPLLPSRRRYLLDRAAASGILLAAETVESLAEAADGFHTLDGWLARLALTARVNRRPLNYELVVQLLAEDSLILTPTIEQVARVVATQFSISLRELRSSSQRRVVVGPRHLAMCLMRELTRASYRAIGAYFGHRDAATIRHGCKAAALRLATEPALAAVADRLRRHWGIARDGAQSSSP